MIKVRHIISKNALSEEKDIVPGGLAENRPDSDFDKAQIEKGIKVELEHTDDKELAKEIAKDHLAEFPDYYDALDEMEKKLEDKASFSMLAASNIIISKVISGYE